MTRLTARSGLILLAAWVVIVFLMMNTGASIMSSAPVLRSPDCPLPCWHGIRPGAIVITEANEMLVGQGYMAQNSTTDQPHVQYRPVNPACEVRLQHVNAIVNEIRLSACPALVLGDLIAELGRPATLSPNTLLFGFADGTLHVQLLALDCDAHLSPFTPVDYLSFKAESVTYADEVTWRGFAFPWRYKRLKPNIVPLAC